MLCKELLDDKTLASFGDMSAALAAQSAALVAQDDTFVLELAHAENAGLALQRAVESRLLGVLPGGEGGACTIQDALNKLAALGESKMLKKACPTSKGQLEALHDMLCKLQRGVSPAQGLLEGAVSDHAKAVLVRLELFATYKKGDGSVQRGRSAVESLYQDAVQAWESEEGRARLSLGQLEWAHQFAWLLAPEQREKIGAMCRELLNNAKTVTAQPKDSQAAKIKKRKSSEGVTEESARGKVMRLFKKG
jgi:hypothetical protein